MPEVESRMSGLARVLVVVVWPRQSQRLRQRGKQRVHPKDLARLHGVRRLARASESSRAQTEAPYVSTLISGMLY